MSLPSAALLADGFTLCVEPRPGQCVHVEGWNKGCVFQYVRSEHGEAVLLTPKTRKEYRTRNRLLNTRKHSANADLSDRVQRGSLQGKVRHAD